MEQIPEMTDEVREAVLELYNVYNKLTALGFRVVGYVPHIDIEDNVLFEGVELGCVSTLALIKQGERLWHPASSHVAEHDLWPTYPVMWRKLPTERVSPLLGGE